MLRRTHDGGIGGGKPANARSTPGDHPRRGRQADPDRVQAATATGAQPGKALLHTELLTKVRGPEYRDDRAYLWAYIWHLRRKLEPDPERPRYILSELVIDYVLECSSAA